VIARSPAIFFGLAYAGWQGYGRLVAGCYGATITAIVLFFEMLNLYIYSLWEIFINYFMGT